MKVNFSSYNPINYSYFQKSQAGQPAFGSAKARKLIEKIKVAKNLRYINATFDDMVAVYEELGYKVLLKRGSHAVVEMPDKKHIPLIIPHGSKYVHPFDIKRLQLILNGDIERALTI